MNVQTSINLRQQSILRSKLLLQKSDSSRTSDIEIEEKGYSVDEDILGGNRCHHLVIAILRCWMLDACVSLNLSGGAQKLIGSLNLCWRARSFLGSDWFNVLKNDLHIHFCCLIMDPEEITAYFKRFREIHLICMFGFFFSIVTSEMMAVNPV